MPDLTMLIDGVSLILQYGLLVALYYFIYRVVKAVYIDLKNDDDNEKKHKLIRAGLSIVSTGETEMEHKTYTFSMQITIGRDDDNDIVIDDKYISHHHAVITRQGSEFVLEDLESINHTYLNGTALQDKKVLKNGDYIKIGMVVLKFER